MAVTLRLSRIGKKHVPFFRIIAVDSRNKRDGAFLDDLGTYDALAGKLVTFHEDKFSAWLTKGAQVSDAVQRLHKLYKKANESSKTVKPAGDEKKAKAAPKKKVSAPKKATSSVPKEENSADSKEAAKK